MSKKQKKKGKVGLLAMLAAIAALVLGYFQCDQFGLGKGDKTQDEQAASATSTSSQQVACDLSISAKGIRFEDTIVTIEQAVKACEGKGSVKLTKRGSATLGQIDDLKEALQQANLKVFEQADLVESASSAASSAASAEENAEGPGDTDEASESSPAVSE